MNQLSTKTTNGTDLHNHVTACADEFLEALWTVYWASSFDSELVKRLVVAAVVPVMQDALLLESSEKKKAG